MNGATMLLPQSGRERESGLTSSGERPTLR
jgi:hypothetical protein